MDKLENLEKSKKCLTKQLNLYYRVSQFFSYERNKY